MISQANYKSKINETLVELMQFDFPNQQGDSGWLGHLAIPTFLLMLYPAKTFVELGVHKGHSFLAFCNAAKVLNTGTRCYGIDTWEGDQYTGEYGNEVLYDLHNTIEKNQVDCHLIKSTFENALKDFQDDSIDVLHIDGSHSYNDVKSDYELWCRKVSSNGLILIHDIAVRGNGYEVWKFWDQLKDKYVNYVEFMHSNGLGIICKSDNCNISSLNNFFLYYKSEPKLITNFFKKIGGYEKKVNQLDDLALAYMRIKNDQNK